MAKKKKINAWKIGFWIASTLALIFLVFYIGSVNGYNELEKEYMNFKLTNNCDYVLIEYLAEHDCWERALGVECYEGKVFCYEEPQLTRDCESGYSLACIKD